MNENYDELDLMMFDYFESNNNVPNLITEKINTAFNYNEKHIGIIEKIKKVIITIIGIVSITGGIVFANQIIGFIMYLFDSNKGVNKALENGYVQNTDMDYIPSNNSSVPTNAEIFNNAELKVDYIMMDDYNLGIVFNMKLEHNQNEEKILNISIPNLIITDENNNIIVAEFENNEKYLDYCKANNIEANYRNFAYFDGSKNIKLVENNEDNIIFTYKTASTNFPKSNNLKISLDKILLSTEEKIKEYAGKWEINTDLSEMTNKRLSYTYSVVDVNDEKIQITKAFVSMTNMQLELITDSDKIDYIKLKDRNYKRINDMLLFHDCYIKDENNNIYGISNSSVNGYETLNDGKYRYYQTFDLTAYDNANNIEIYLTTNKDEQIIIKLKKNRDSV